MESKPFFKGLSWLLILNLIIKPVWIFAIDRQVQNAVGHEKYGTYFALLNLTIVLLFIADAGLSNMVSRHLADKRTANASQLLQLKLILLLLYTAICCLVGWFTKISAWNILLYAIIIQALGSLFLFLRSLLTANQFFKPDAFFSVLDKSFMIILCGLFVYGWWKPMQLEIFLQLQLFSIVFACLLLLFYLQKKELIRNGSKQQAREILKWTLPFATIILLMSMHYRLDVFLLERMRADGSLQAGMYATAYRLLDAANMIGYLTASFLVPFIARNKNDGKLVSPIVNKLQQILLFIAIGTSCFAFVFPSWIQQTLYHTNSSTNNTIFQLCLAVLPAYYLIHIHGSVLTAFGKLKAFISILSISVLINIVLNFLLIPTYGTIGCCIAALVSQYTCAVACYFAAGRNLSDRLSIKYWLIYFLMSGAFLLAFFLLKRVIPSVWTILAIIVLVSIIIAAKLTKSFKPFLTSFIQQKNA